MEIIKIGSIELTKEEIKKFYYNHKYLVTYSKVYQLNYSEPAGYYGNVVYTCNRGENLAKRGRFHAMDAVEVNNLLGFKLLRED